jgi:CheY-like chemotaxis protein
VKGIEKITSVRLAEILSDRGIVTSEVITDALYAQEKHGEPFAQVLVTGGHITEWDLAKIVTENFNLPFLMAGNYHISDEAKARLPKEVLFEHTIVPLDVFGDIVCVAMPVMLTFEAIARIQKDHQCDLFPYVGLITENKKVITEMHKDYPQWLEQEAKRRELAAKKRTNPFGKQGGDWMSIFDAGDMAIQQTNKKKGAPAAPSASATQAAPHPPKPPKK